MLKASRGHWAEAFAALDIDGDGLISEADLAEVREWVGCCRLVDGSSHCGRGCCTWKADLADVRVGRLAVAGWLIH